MKLSKNAIKRLKVAKVCNFTIKNICSIFNDCDVNGNTKSARKIIRIVVKSQRFGNKTANMLCAKA